MKKGEIVKTDFFGVYIEKVEIKFEIDITKNSIDISFVDFCIEDCDSDKLSQEIYIYDNDKKAITLEKCYFKTRSSKASTIICIAVIYGDHISNLENTLAESVSFVIGSDPVPLIGYNMPFNQYQLNNGNVLLKTEWYENSLVKLEAISVYKNISVEDLQDVLFRVLEILFLCFGFYPYIEKVIIKYRDKNIDVYYNHHNEYKKGNSRSHWLTIITEKNDINLQTAYNLYTLMFKKIINVIKVMTNASHTNTIVINLILSLLIQCVEGYMRANHSSKKFPEKLKNDILDTIKDSLNNFDFTPLLQQNVDRCQIENSITGMLGHINDNSLADCLNNAFNLNEYTKMILNQEINDTCYSEFITKSKATRNQFSHMSLQKKAFENFHEIIMAKDKYILLLRVLLLSDLQIPINQNRLSKWIESIGESYKTNMDNDIN